MRRIAFVAVVGSIAGVLLAERGQASLYTAEEPYAIPVGNDGMPVPLKFDEFKRRLAGLTNALMPKLGEKPSEERTRFLERISAREKNPKLSASDAAAQATDLLRVGQPDKALALLTPHTADRRPDYFVFTTLGHVHAMRGDAAGWAEALRYHQDGQLDAKMPETLKGMSKQQRDWWAKLDADYLPHFYRIRRHEAEFRSGLTPTAREKADETEDVLPLFPLPVGDKPVDPVRFVNDAGVYQPGVIAASEKAKLPPDALAIVQQLMLWFPQETRLYWLLAELYAVNGDVTSAAAILDECTWGRQYGNRKVLMAHRQALQAASAAQPQKTSPEDTPLVQPTQPTDQPGPVDQPPISLGTVWIYLGVVGAIAVLAFLRAIIKRKPGDCGPVG